MRAELRRIASSIGTPSLLLTEREAAQLLSVSVKTLYLWRRAGTLPYIAIGASGVRYDRRDLEAFIASRRRGGQP
jgi:excisionase family DNA binding protein